MNEGQWVASRINSITSQAKMWRRNRKLRAWGKCQGWRTTDLSAGITKPGRTLFFNRSYLLAQSIALTKKEEGLTSFIFDGGDLQEDTAPIAIGASELSVFLFVSPKLRLPRFEWYLEDVPRLSEYPGINVSRWEMDVAGRVFGHQEHAIRNLIKQAMRTSSFNDMECCIEGSGNTMAIYSVNHGKILVRDLGSYYLAARKIFDSLAFKDFIPAYSECIRKAREAFSSQDYDLAGEYFEIATHSRELDPVSKNMANRCTKNVENNIH